MRVITNIFGGSLGCLITDECIKYGCNVTLLLGNSRYQPITKSKRLRIIKFKTYSDLKSIFLKQLKAKKYDIVIQSAAVSDYTPVSVKNTKIKSGKKELVIRLIPTEKIVDYVKKIDENIFLVKFKLETDISTHDLVRKAKKSMKTSNADLMVANDFKTVRKNHVAFLITQIGKVQKFYGKVPIVRGLLSLLNLHYA